MKVLFIQIVQGLAGSEKYFIEIMPMLKAKGIDCEFLCVHLSEDNDKHKLVTDPLEKAGIKVHFVESKSRLNLNLLKNINEVIKTGSYDFVNTHLIYGEVWLALIKIFFNRKVKIVSTRHGYNADFTDKYGFDPKKRVYNPFYILTRFAGLFSSGSIAVSQALKDFYIGQKVCKKDTVDVVHHSFDFGIDVDVQISERAKSLKKSAHQLVIVGRLIGFKGHRHLFSAISKLVDKHPDLKLFVVGKGDLKNILEEQVKSLKLEQHIIFEGFQKNPIDYMIASDIVMIPSTSEGFGIVFLEAFASQTPVIAFNVSASNEIIIDEETGLLVTPYDVDEMAEKIDRLLSNSEERKRLSDNALTRLNTYFKPERMVDETIAFYEKISKI